MTIKNYTQMERKTKKLTTPLVISCALLFAGMMILQSCYYHKPDITLPVSTCDTSAVKFSTHVKPILDNNCVSCHSAGFPSGGFEFDTYTGFKQAVNAGLVPAVFFRTGLSRMPQGQDPLSSCDIAVIRTWIRNGALNN